MRRLHCLTPGSHPNIKELAFSNLASVRLRTAVCAASMQATGWHVTVGDTITHEPDIVVVGKPGANQIEARGSLWLRQLRDCRVRRSTIAVDYTDNHLAFNSPMTRFYSEVFTLCDFGIVPSAHMRNLLSNYWPGRTQIIEDPIEVPSLPPKEELQHPRRILWFGHASNLNYLVQFVNDCLRPCSSLDLLIVTDSNGLEFLKRSNIRRINGLSISFLPWSVQNMIEAARVSDACIIPSDTTDPAKSGASSNRLITALALGLPTAAEKLSSYEEFSEHFVDLRSNAFSGFLENPTNFSHLVRSAQLEIVSRFSRDMISAAWQYTISRASTSA